MQSVLEAAEYSERDMIVALLASFYILDYGFVSKVNADGTVNVTHAKLPKMLDGTELPETRTNNLEVLTLSGGGFALQWDIEAGDQVLLLGLKDYIPEVSKVTKSSKQESFIHYNRDTMKVFPLSAFNPESRVVIRIEKGTLKADTQKKIELNGNTSHLVTYEELAAALNTFVTALNSHTHGCPSGGGTSSTPTAMTLNISGAKAGKVTTKAGD